jgi:3-oxoacyl-ACP reductase-like protein
MGIFDSIKHAIFGDNGPLGGQFGGHKVSSPEAGANPATASRAPIPMAQPAPQAAAPAAQGNPTTAVDVEAILSQKAATAGHASNWRTSIVDLLQLLGLESSLQARKELANELNIHVGADGSAEENIALHRAVMQKLAANGGKVPTDLLG